MGGHRAAGRAERHNQGRASGLQARKMSPTQQNVELFLKEKKKKNISQPKALNLLSSGCSWDNRDL